MKHKKEKCKYCGADLESKTTRKEFCSSKCRVYWNREAKQAEPPAPVPKIVPEKPTKKEITPPPGLKGIDLSIWREEHEDKKK